MSNIFGGVEPPSWLQEQANVNRERGQWGQLAGTAMAGFINGLQRNPGPELQKMDGDSIYKTDGEGQGTGITVEGPRKGFLQGLTEARLNQTDPLWRIKAASAQANIWGNIAQAESAFALAKERRSEMEAWASDSATLSPWLAATPEQRQSMTAPVARSQKGQSLLEQLSTRDSWYWTQKENQDILRQRAENNSAAAKIAVQDRKKFLNDLGNVVDPAERTAILDKLDENGNPTADAWRALSAAPKLTERERVANTNSSTRLTIAANAEAGKDTRQLRSLQTKLDMQQAAFENQRYMADLNSDNAMKRDEARAKLQASISKELLQMKGEQWDRQHAYWMAPPKIETMDDGTMIVTRGPQMNVIKPSASGLNAAAKEDLRMLGNTVLTYQKQVAASTNEDPALKGKLLDAQIAFANALKRYGAVSTRKPAAAPVTPTPAAAAPQAPAAEADELWPEDVMDEEPPTKAAPPSPAVSGPVPEGAYRTGRFIVTPVR